MGHVRSEAFPSKDAISQPGLALKRLFREVAKRVHPDLASHEADRRRRERLMAEANQAFEDGDAGRLAQILEQCALKPDLPQGTAVAEDIVRTTRKATLNLRLHLTFLERFDKEPMKRHRGALAKQFLAATPNERLQEQVMQFFDEMHWFLHDTYVDEDLIWATFGFRAVRWWAACHDYVAGERERRTDRTLFAGFEELAARFSKLDAKLGFKEPSFAELIRFLEEERKLLT